VISKNNQSYVIDTKWKLVNYKPSIEDIRQMYVYHHYFNAQKVALLYPGTREYNSGQFIDIKEQNKLSAMECGLLFTGVESKLSDWQKNLIIDIESWLNSEI
jgi:5-methylcytosine-specific restriction enzyme subunit McrC